MHIRDLSGKNICILGYGKEGRAMAEAIEKYAKEATITIADQSQSLPATRYPLLSGPDAFNNLSQFDVIIKSPGIPPHTLPATRCPLVSPTQIFFDSIAGSGATVIGITGSKGKSTTSSLIHHILATRQPLPATRSFLIGNIGNPAIAHIDQAKKGTAFVMELSSYQLMDLATSPTIAVLTSFFPEHLDYHRNLKNYLDAKKHITKFQEPGSIVFFNAASEECEEIAEEGEGKKVGVVASDAPVDLRETKLIGAHNQENIALAWKVAEHLGVQKDAAISAIKSFSPLPHRLQSLGVHHGKEWINDSISTTPESAIAALDALGDRVGIMILGGQDRGLNFGKLVERINQSSVEMVITLGESGPRIAKALESTSKKVEQVQSLTEAVESATRYPLVATHPNPIVLLSPASPSYDQFKNFEERGKKFTEYLIN